MKTCHDIIALLENELANRQAHNGAYSLRAFAKFLGVSPAALSQAIARKRKLSKQNSLRIASQLHLAPGVVNAMLNNLGYKADQRAEKLEHQFLDDATFNVISDWYYLAVLNLARLKDVSTDASHMAERLGIDAMQAATAIETLQRLGLISITRGFLQRTAQPLTTPTDVPSEARRRYHRQILGLASESLEKVPVALRDFSTTTIPLNVKNLDKVKELIFQFSRKMVRLMENDDPKEIYALAIQLFPLTKVRDKHV